MVARDDHELGVQQARRIPMITDDVRIRVSEPGSADI
jgi:hypothetical protein